MHASIAVQDLSHKVLAVIYRVVAVGHVALGVSILIGGIARFPYPTYQPMLDLTRGAVWPWGAVIITSGVAMLIPHRVLNLAGLGVGFCWFNLFSAMFAVALWKYDESGSTAPVPYFILGAIHVALLTLKIAEYRDARRRKASQWTHQLS